MKSKKPVKGNDRKILTGLGAGAVVLVVVLYLILAKAPDKEPLKRYQATRFYMDTYIQLMVAAPASDEKKVNEAMAQAFEQFASLEKEYNFYSSKGQLIKVNTMMDGSLDDLELLKILNLSLEYAKTTDGAFDPTLGALKLIYPIGEKDPVPPGDDKISDALALTGYKRVKIEANIVHKPEGLLFDLGGLLKGYAVDGAYGVLASNGLKNFMVNGGGNIRGRGVNEKGVPWRVGVENPRIKGAVVGVIPLNDMAVATSGDYQRFFFYNKVRYHHIMDPKTGKPANRAIMATVIAPDAMTADVYSTAVFIMGRDKGLQFLESRGMEGIVLDEKGYAVTKGLKDKIQIDFKGAEPSPSKY